MVLAIAYFCVVFAHSWSARHHCQICLHSCQNDHFLFPCLLMRSHVHSLCQLKTYLSLHSVFILNSPIVMIFLQHLGCLTYFMPWGIQMCSRCQAKWKECCVKWKMYSGCHEDGCVMFLKTLALKHCWKLKYMLASYWSIMQKEQKCTHHKYIAW